MHNFNFKEWRKITCSEFIRAGSWSAPECSVPIGEIIHFPKENGNALLMLNLKEKNTLIRMKQAGCIDLTNLLSINIYLAGS